MNEIHKETLDLLNKDTVSTEDQKKLDTLIRENRLNDVFWNAKDKVKDIVSKSPNKEKLMTNIQKLIAEKGSGMEEADRRGLMFVYFLAEKGVMYANQLGGDAGKAMDDKFNELASNQSKIEPPKANPTPEKKNTHSKSPDILKDLNNVPADVNAFLDAAYAQLKGQNNSDAYFSLSEFKDKLSKSGELQKLVADLNFQDKLKDQEEQKFLDAFKIENLDPLEKNILKKSDASENVIAEIEGKLKNKLTPEEKGNLKKLFDAMSSENIDFATLKKLLNEDGQKDLKNLLNDYTELKTQKDQLLNLLTGKVKSVIDGLQTTLLNSRNIQLTPNVVGASGLNVNLEKILELSKILTNDPEKKLAEGKTHLENKAYLQAASAFEQAANAGSGEAAFQLGKMFMEGPSYRELKKSQGILKDLKDEDLSPEKRLGGTGYMKKAIFLYQQKWLETNKSTDTKAAHADLMKTNPQYQEAYRIIRPQRRDEWDSATDTPRLWPDQKKEDYITNFQYLFHTKEQVAKENGTTSDNTTKTETTATQPTNSTDAKADDEKETLDTHGKSKEKTKKSTGSVILDTEYTSLNEDMDVGSYGSGMLNIYKNLPRHDREAYKRIFDVAKRHLRSVNLSSDQGLSDIIEAIFDEKNTDTKSLRDTLNKEPKGQITKEQLKDAFKGKVDENGELIYKKKGIIAERGKIANILNDPDTKVGDLQVVAHIVEAGMDLKNMANDKLALKTGFEAKNVFGFLSDYNTSGKVDVNDVGSTFGLQLTSEIDRAMAKVGESKVIVKLLQRAQLTGDDATSAKIDTFLKDNANPDRAGLYKFLSEAPQAKLYLNSAIRMINGAADRVTPDLYNTLTGFDTGSEAMNDNESKLQDAFDHWIDTKLNDPARVESNKSFVLEVKNLGKHEMSSRFRRMINSVLDDMEVQTTNDGSGEMTDTGIKKQFELAALKNKLLQKLTHNFLSGQVQRDPRSMQINTGFGRQWVSESMRDKIKRGVAPGVKIENGIPVAINIGAALKVDHQYNYKKVIGSSLDAKRIAADYVSLEARANAQIGIDGKNTGAKVEASAGLGREREFLIGVTQMGRNYGEFNDDVLVATLESADSIKDAGTLETVLKAKIEEKGKDSKYEDFVKNNIDRLHFNAIVLRKFVEQEGLLEKIKNLSPEKKKEALSQLLGTIQRGQVEMRKDDTLNALNGKVKLTGIGIGVLAGLGRGRGGANPDSPFSPGPGHDNSNTGGNAPIEDVVEGGPRPSPEVVSKKIKLLGGYISARLSTWETFYVPNAVKLKSVEQDLQTGKRFLEQSLGIQDYAKNLDAVLNGTSDPEKKMFVITPDTTTNTVKITAKEGGKSLHELLHIYHKPTKKADASAGETPKTDESDLNFKYDGKTLEIGDIAQVAALNVSDRKGDKTFLVLGAKGIGGGESGEEALTKLEGAFNQTKTLEGMKKNKEGQLDQAGIIKVFDKLLANSKVTETIKAKLEAVKAKVTDGKIALTNNVVQDLTKGGTLTVTSTPSGEILTFDSTLKGKLKIVYKDNQIETPTSQNIDFVDYNKQFAQLEQDLAALDMVKLYNATGWGATAYNRTSKGPYAEFMRLSTFGDGNIDTNDYQACKKPLKQMLQAYKNSVGGSNNADDIINGLDSYNEAQLGYVINRFKQLSSIHIAHTEKKVDGDLDKVKAEAKLIIDEFKANSNTSGVATQIESILATANQDGYGQKIESLDWDTLFDNNPDKAKELYYLIRPAEVVMKNKNTMMERYQPRDQSFGLMINKDPDAVPAKAMLLKYRNEVGTQIKGLTTWSTEKQSNMVGLTAFYRAFGTPGFGMLQPGEANIIKGSEVSIESGDHESAKNFFVRKLERNDHTARVLAQVLEQKTGLKFTKQNVIDIVNKNETTIDGKTIKMEYEMVFYAMGECSNESLGLKIKTITVPGLGEIDGEAEIPPQPGSTLATRQASINDQIDAVEKNVSLRHNQFVRSKQEGSKYDPDPDHGDGDDGGNNPIDPNTGDGTSGTGGNGGIGDVGD